VLVLRDTTERPEAVEAGVARVVGTAPAVVHAAVSMRLDDHRAYRAMAHPENRFGDGRASARVVAALAEGRARHRAA
jgi:UDP-N-acetylglucosamine 2-epimerase (non-hydrolysing)